MTPHCGDEAPHPSAADPGTAELDVCVRMFGMVCAMTGERELTLRLPLDAVVNDVIRALAERYKTALFEEAMSNARQKTSHCRISVDGYLVQDLNAPLRTKGSRTTVEIILLSAFEGG